MGLRLQNLDNPQIKVSPKPSTFSDNEGVCLTDALELYLKLKGQGKDHVFFRTANRNIRYVTNLLRDKPLSANSFKEAGQFRDWFFEERVNNGDPLERARKYQKMWIKESNIVYSFVSY